jgi:hypothetical protein
MNSTKKKSNKPKKLTKTVKNMLKRKLMERNEKKMLELVCPNSSMCLAFNKYYSDLLKQYFNHFLSFEYVDSAKRISEKSANGKATIVKYIRDGYESSVIVKTIDSMYSYSTEIDNLYYEAYVGMTVVNPLCNLYPVFVETYGVGTSKRKIFHDDLVDVKRLDSSEFKSLYRPKDINASFRSFSRDMITNRENHVLFAQTIDTNLNLLKFVEGIASHINKIVDMYENKNTDDDVITSLCMETLERCYNLDAILFQVYHALECEKTKFAHNDLHCNNIMIYKVPLSHHITYNYFDSKDNKDVTISTPYIPKIIDYGMSFTDKSFEFIKKVSMVDEAKLCVYFTNLNSETMPNMFLDSDQFINYLKKEYDIEVECISELDELEPHYSFIKLKTKSDLQRILDLIQKFKEVYSGKFDDHGSIMFENDEEVYVKTMKDVKHVFDNHEKIRKNMCDAFLDYNGMRWAVNDHIEENYYASSILYNGSIDLKCFHSIIKLLYKSFNRIGKLSNIQNIYLSAVKAWMNNLVSNAPVFENMYGTPYVERGEFPEAIVNVEDAMKFFRRNLEDVSLSPDSRTPNEILNQHVVSRTANYATIDVFCNGQPMRVDIGTTQRNAKNNSNTFFNINDTEESFASNHRESISLNKFSMNNRNHTTSNSNNEEMLRGLSF